jgi:NAD(P)H dehydrogenase (quinone)
VADLLDFMAIRSALDGVSGAYFLHPIVPGIVDATAYFGQAAKEATVSTVDAAFNHWMAERVF